MKRIEHIGIAVADLQAAERIFSDVLGESPFKREHVASEGVDVSFFHTGESKVELLASTSPRPHRPAHRQARRRPASPSVFCGRYPGEIERLTGLGYRVISGPKEGADNKGIAFLHPGDTNRVLVELCAERG